MPVARINPRKSAVDIITHWLKSDDNIDFIRDRFINDSINMDDRDRSLVTEIVFGVVRHKESLDKRLTELVHGKLEKMQHPLYAVLLVGLYQLLYLNRVPNYSIVDEAVKLTRELLGESATGLVNAVLRKAAIPENTESRLERPIDAFYAGKGSLHKWRNKWVQQWGEDKTDELVRFYGNIPPVGLRRNRLKTPDDKTWIEILKSEGVDPELVPGWKGFVYTRGIRPSSLPSFEAGITTVQDPSAGIAPVVLDPQPGENVLDLCCAPGGKTALIWELMEGRGTLLGIDRSMKRNKKTREGLNRLGHEGVKILTEDVIKLSAGLFDRVLIDVPCSGTGVAHRRADLLVRRAPLQASAMSKLQRSLLEHASKRVKPGGVLVYSTCSLEPEENEERVRITEKKLGDQFERDELPEIIPQAWRCGNGEAATWPPRDKVDGVFVVRWRRLK